jgi:hypothetical protein
MIANNTAYTLLPCVSISVPMLLSKCKTQLSMLEREREEEEEAADSAAIAKGGEQQATVARRIKPAASQRSLPVLCAAPGARAGASSFCWGSLITIVSSACKEP